MVFTFVRDNFYTGEKFEQEFVVLENAINLLENSLEENTDTICYIFHGNKKQPYEYLVTMRLR